MRLGIAFAQPSGRIDRCDRIVRGHSAFTALDHVDLEIDHPGQQQAVGADHAPDPGAREGRVAPGGHLGVIALRIAIAQIVRNTAFGPQDEPVGTRFPRHAERGDALELLFEARGVIDLVLPQIGLDQRERHRSFARLTGRQINQYGKGSCSTCQGKPSPGAQQVGKQHRGAGHQPRQRVAAGKGQRRRQSGAVPRAQHHHRQRTPGIAAEDPAAQPFRADPHRAEYQREGEQPAPARGAPRDTSRERGPYGEVERQQRRRGPAENGRHFRLIGKGGGDPVVGDGEMGEAEQPTGKQRRAPSGGAPRQPAERADRRKPHRPEVERLEAQGRQAAQHEGGDLRVRTGQAGEFLHRLAP